MTIYESVKASVTPRMAAERYGLKVHPNGMACCPFHPDRHPSMKLNQDYYYCFGCGSRGDVVDLIQWPLPQPGSWMRNWGYRGLAIPLV